MPSGAFRAAAMLAALAVALVLTVAACEDPIEVVCQSDPPPPGIAVEVLNAATGYSPVGADTLHGTLTDGDYSEVMTETRKEDGTVQGRRTLSGAFGNREGTYDIEIASTRYQTWSRQGVVVKRAGECDVQTVKLTARMNRL